MKTRFGRLFLACLLLTGGIITGCDSGSHSPLGQNPLPVVPGTPEPNPALMINLDTSAASVSGITEWEVIAYNLRGAELVRQVVSVGQTALLENLPAGSIQLRVVGHNASDQVLGFCDLSATVPNSVSIDAPALTPGSALPPIATPGAPFLAFTGLPAVYQSGVDYSVEVSAFNAQGRLETSVNGSVGLSVSGIAGVQPSAGVLFHKGRAVFSAIKFPQGSDGTVSFTASAGNFQPAISPTLPVRSSR